jgi:TRAP-type C4-dicarboxylate transport system substrate-binding protein
MKLIRRKDEMKKLSIILLMAVILISVCSLMVSAQAKYVLKFNHVLSPNEPYHQGFLNWAERVKERTNGGLEIQVFHSAHAWEIMFPALQ